MKSRGEMIISSLIIAAALIICTSKLTNTNAFMGILQASGGISSNVNLNSGQVALESTMKYLPYMMLQAI